MPRRRTKSTTAKLGRDTVEMLRDVARRTRTFDTLDETIWLLAESLKAASRANHEAIPLQIRSGIPSDRAVYRQLARGEQSGVPNGKGQTSAED